MKNLILAASFFLLGLSMHTTGFAKARVLGIKQEAGSIQKKEKAKMKSENEVMRKQAKVEAQKNGAVKTKADGTPDKRYKENKKLKSDGTPDKRYKENKGK